MPLRLELSTIHDACLAQYVVNALITKEPRIPCLNKSVCLWNVCDIAKLLDPPRWRRQVTRSSLYFASTLPSSSNSSTSDSTRGGFRSIASSASLLSDTNTGGPTTMPLMRCRLLATRAVVRGPLILRLIETPTHRGCTPPETRKSSQLEKCNTSSIHATLHSLQPPSTSPSMH